jgi:DNA-binding NarL/FixJ family response regulator
VGIRVLLAEDNALLREGIRRILETAADLELVGTCADYDSLLSHACALRPDVVVTDIRMPPSGTDEGIRAAAELRRRDPGMGVVVLSQYVNPRYALDLLESGSAGRAYLLKDRVADIAELLGAVRAVAVGGSVIDPIVVEQLVGVHRPARSELGWLTKREREVLCEVATGKTNVAVARALVLSERAVEKHINSIFSKLGLTEAKDVNRRVKAVLLYLTETQ